MLVLSRLASSQAEVIIMNWFGLALLLTLGIDDGSTSRRWYWGWVLALIVMIAPLLVSAVGDRGVHPDES